MSRQEIEPNKWSDGYTAKARPSKPQTIEDKMPCVGCGSASHAWKDCHYRPNRFNTPSPKPRIRRKH